MSEPLYLGTFKIEKELGEGTFGKVRLATYIKKNKKFALKTVQKDRITKHSQVTRIKDEVSIWRLLKHPYIVQLEDVKETEHEIVMVMEYIPGGELHNYLTSSKNGILSEEEARRLFRQMVSAVDYCHQNCIIHRDLKPENMLLDRDKNIKLADFGFVTTYDPFDVLFTCCGSLKYASPEIVMSRSYVGPEVDIWSLGVTLYAMLSGKFPFYDDNVSSLIKLICDADFGFTDVFTEDAKDLISKMLIPETKKRATMKLILNHDWISRGYANIPIQAHLQPKEAIPDITSLDSSVIQKMHDYGFQKYVVEDKLVNTTTTPEFSIYTLVEEFVAVKKRNLKLLEMENAIIAGTVSSSRCSSSSFQFANKIQNNNIGNNSKSSSLLRKTSRGSNHFNLTTNGKLCNSASLSIHGRRPSVALKVKETFFSKYSSSLSTSGSQLTNKSRSYSATDENNHDRRRSSGLQSSQERFNEERNFKHPEFLIEKSSDELQSAAYHEKGGSFLISKIVETPIPKKIVEIPVSVSTYRASITATSIANDASKKETGISRITKKITRRISALQNILRFGTKVQPLPKEINQAELCFYNIISLKTINEFKADITLLFTKQLIYIDWKSNFCGNCVIKEKQLEFEIEICKIKENASLCIVYRLMKGSPFTFNTTMGDISGNKVCS